MPEWFDKMTFSSLWGITFAPLGIYLSPDADKRELLSKDEYNELVNHENIHWNQQMEMFIIFFYIWYILEWTIKLPVSIFTKKSAYDMLAFEREANAHESDLDYLKTRKRFAWVKYIV